MIERGRRGFQCRFEPNIAAADVVLDSGTAFASALPVALPDYGALQAPLAIGV